MNPELAGRSRSVHDNVIVSYEVGCKSREIVFHTELPVEPPELTDVTFSGVVCYALWYDTVLGNIVFSFDECAAIEVYAKCEAEMKAGVPYGWPGDWAKSKELAQHFFDENGIKGWWLSSSLGMTGWILARAMETTAAKARE